MVYTKHVPWKEAVIKSKQRSIEWRNLAIRRKMS